ncbi:unnamed protein product [Paramecium sonneborni]|uniref:RING-type domain-containing protein n=1 Tax=Paramecium sonneborni TaxID=65129 RepID=A0A8S1Q0A8_9CILI|nr:unnamed protein product [Paramecium sonneborni]
MDNRIINLIEIIAESGNRGKELMIDSFILGVAWGRKIINTDSQAKMASNYLYDFNQKLEYSGQSPFKKSDLFNKFLNEENYNVFSEIKEILEKKLYQEDLKNQTNQIVTYEKKKICYQQVCSICDFYINDQDEERCQIQQCKHLFHNLCLYLYLDKEGNNTCPGCQNELNINLKESIFDKISISCKSCCPNPQCNQEFIYNGQQYYQCLQCNFKFCLNCKQIEHDDNCKFEIDFFPMSLGQRFKICYYCPKITIFNFTDFHQCKPENQQQNQISKVTFQKKIIKKQK